MRVAPEKAERFADILAEAIGAWKRPAVSPA
jgi:hypothetical protein